MASSTVTTSIVVQFSKGDSDSVLSVEVDSRETADGGLNNGSTSFLPGDPVHLLLFRSDNVKVLHYEPSLGSLSPMGQATIEKEEFITFANETEANLAYPRNSGVAYTWLGNNLGTLTAVEGSQTKLRIPTPAKDTYAVGVAKVTYQTTGYIYKLTHSALVGLSEYQIVAFFLGSTL